MSTPFPPRRSERVRAPPELFAEEQASYAAQEAQAAVLRSIRREAIDYDLSDFSEDELPSDDESSSSEEEVDEKENVPPDGGWSAVTRYIRPFDFNTLSGSNLPRRLPRSELAYVEQFITADLVSTIATNINLYGASKGATEQWQTSAAEVWRFIAVRIFMGIVDLPYLHQYWEEGWTQPYVSDTFSRDRFKQLLRYFHIGVPTPSRSNHCTTSACTPSPPTSSPHVR